MRNNTIVAYTVDDDEVRVMEITGIQMEGKAPTITDEAEAGTAFQLMLEKFPFIIDMPADNDNMLLKVELVTAYYLDYKKVFGYRDMVSY